MDYHISGDGLVMVYEGVGADGCKLPEVASEDDTDATEWASPSIDAGVRMSTASWTKVGIE